MKTYKAVSICNQRTRQFVYFDDSQTLAPILYRTRPVEEVRYATPEERDAALVVMGGAVAFGQQGHLIKAHYQLPPEVAGFITGEHTRLEIEAKKAEALAKTTRARRSVKGTPAKVTFGLDVGHNTSVSELEHVTTLIAGMFNAFPDKFLVTDTEIRI